MREDQRGSSMVMLAAVVSVVLAVAATMRLVVQRAAQARIAYATVDMLRLPQDSGDGVETQRFGAESPKEVQGFLDDPKTLAVSKNMAHESATEDYRGRSYRIDESSSNRSESTSVGQELLPKISKSQ